MTVLFSDRVLLGGADGPFRLVAAAVVLDGHSIRKVVELPRSRLASRFPDEAVVDVDDRLITPAFVNGHTHLALTFLRGVAEVSSNAGNVIEDLYYPTEENLTAADVRAFVKVAAYESLLCGVGCVWDHYYFAREVAEACAEVGLSAVVCPTLQDVAGPGKDAWEAQLDATAAIDDDERLREAGVVAALGPHATDTVSDELWGRVSDVADARGLWWHAHVSQSFEEFQRSIERHGVTPVERLHRLGALDAGAGALLVHGLYLSDDDVARLSPARHVLGYCPFSQLQFAFPLPLDSFRERGIPMLVATDCAAGNDTWNVQQELRLVAGGAAFATTASTEHEAFRREGTLEAAAAVRARRQHVFDARLAWAEPAELLRTVFATPGRLHPRLPLGEIAAGVRANLIVWDSDHPAFWPRYSFLRALVFSDVAPAIWGLVVNGRWVGERGDFHRSLVSSAGYGEAREEASERLEALLSRSGITRR